MPIVDDPETPSPPPSSAAPRRVEVLALTAPLAALGMAAALIGVLVLALPVHSPLQDCGTSFGFLIHGRTDVYADPANPPPGATAADVKANNAKPCRPRVADRARPAALLILPGLVVAMSAAVVEATIRWRRSSHRSRG